MYPLKRGNWIHKDDIIEIGYEGSMDDVLRKAGEWVKKELGDYAANPRHRSFREFMKKEVNSLCLRCPDIKWEQREFHQLDDGSIQVKVPIDGRAEVLGLWPWPKEVPNLVPEGKATHEYLMKSFLLSGLFFSERDVEDRIQTKFDSWKNIVESFLMALQDKYQSWEKNLVWESLNSVHKVRTRSYQDKLVKSVITRLNQK